MISFVWPHQTILVSFKLPSAWVHTPSLAIPGQTLSSCEITEKVGRKRGRKGSQGRGDLHRVTISWMMELPASGGRENRTRAAREVEPQPLATRLAAATQEWGASGHPRAGAPSYGRLPLAGGPRSPRRKKQETQKVSEPSGLLKDRAGSGSLEGRACWEQRPGPH